MANAPQSIRVFISAPDDMASDRDVVINVINDLNYAEPYRESYRLIPYPHENGKYINDRVLAVPEPNRYILRPESSDIFISLLWLRMGRMRGAQISPETGKPYQSSAEYEFMTAYWAQRQKGTPQVLAYRCNRSAPDMKKLDLTEYGRVQKFFERFEQDEALSGHIAEFQSPDDLAALVRSDLERLLSHLTPSTYGGEGRPAPIIVLPNNFPEYYVDRTETYHEVRKALLGSMGAIGVLSAPGGATLSGQGKTVLVRTLCDDPLIRGMNPDGVLWATFGPDADHLRLQQDWIILLNGDIGAASTPETSREELRRLLQDRIMLLVLDDVRSPADVEALHINAPYCTVVITAQEKPAIRDALPVLLDTMSLDEAYQLLARATNNAVSEPLAAEIVQKVGTLPFTLRVIGGVLNTDVQWADLQKDLDAAKTLFQQQSASMALPALKVNIDHLSADEQARYHELAIFPFGEALIEPVVGRLWARTGNLDNNATAALLANFRSRGLLLNDYTFHDLHQDYMRWAKKPHDLVATHEAFVDSFGEVSGSSFPDDHYAWRNLAYHMAKAGRSRELHKLLTDYTYLEFKIARFGTGAVLHDFSTLPDDDTLQTMAEALRTSAAVLDRDPHELPNQLYGRLGAFRGLHDEPATTAPRFRLESSTLTPPNWPLLQTLEKHTYWTTHCEFSPDGQSALTASADKTLRLWDLKTGKSIRTFRGHMQTVNSCAFSGDGQLALSASADQTLQLWSVEAGKTLRTLIGHSDAVNDCALSPDGKMALSASADQTLRLWDTHRGQVLRVFSGHTGAVHSCWLNTEQRLALSASADQTLRLWNIDTGEEIVILKGHEAAVLGCQLSADGSLALSVSADMTVRLWDVNIPERLLMLQGHNHWVLAGAMSTTYRRILSASLDNTVRVWDMESGQQLRVLQGQSGMTSCKLSPNGRRAISTSDKALLVWDITSAKSDQSLPVTAETRAITSPDGELILSVSADRTLQLWETNSKNVRHVLEGHNQAITSCGFSPDSQLVLSASADKTLQLWRVSDGSKVCQFQGHTDAVNDCAFAPDGKLILSAASDKTLRLWNAATGQELTHWTADMPLASCAFANGTEVMARDQAGTIHFLRLENLAAVL